MLVKTRVFSMYADRMNHGTVYQTRKDGALANTPTYFPIVAHYKARFHALYWLLCRGRAGVPKTVGQQRQGEMRGRRA